MAFFDELGKKISDASQSVAQKGKEMSGSFKINMAISDEEKKINSAYTEIGKMYFKLYEGKFDDEMIEQIELIDESLKKIEELNIQLAEVKSTVKCSSCGAENSKTSQFCSTCGAVLKEEVVDTAKVCPNCGAEVQKESCFCPSCGQKIEN